MNKGDGLLGDLRNENCGRDSIIFLACQVEDVENLICLVGQAVNKKNTQCRNAAGVTERSAIALRFPATGDSYDGMMDVFNVPTHSVWLTLQQVCEALMNANVRLQKPVYLYRRATELGENCRKQEHCVHIG